MAILTKEEAKLVDDSSLANQLAQIGTRVRDLELINDLVTELHFMTTRTLQSASASTPVILLPDSSVPAGKKVYLLGFMAKVNGSTNWGTVAEVKITDNSVSPIDMVTFDAQHLAGTEKFYLGANHTTPEDAFIMGQGGATGKGLRVFGDVNGSGSNFVVTVWGVIK